MIFQDRWWHIASQDSLFVHTVRLTLPSDITVRLTLRES